MANPTVLIESRAAQRELALADYLDGAAEERAVAGANAWIKALRHLPVDGQPFRRRFTVRGDSLWWFAELYLHKRQVALTIFRTIAALDRIADEEQPLAIRAAPGARVLSHVVRAFVRARGLGGDRERPARGHIRLARMDARARALMLAASASRLRPRRIGAARGEAAVFVHRAFWRAGSDDGSAESYIGPVLSILERRLAGAGLRYIGVGPFSNFRARRWWHPLLPPRDAAALTPVESFAPLGALRDSRAVWRSRHAYRRLLWASDALRQHAVIAGCDCWPLVREELAGIALLQWPWSVRAMDEAAAALDRLEPAVAVTYAEAGGWGRALVLEARRRGIPTAGLQHGFIYRHWLNYLHEPDEMEPDPAQPEDAGFPRPTLTLLFDEYAAEHLERAGHFDRSALRVTGSPRLDALAASAGGLGQDEIARTRRDVGAAASQAIVLLVTKEREARHVLPSLVAAVAGRPDIHLVIKAHPAETPDAYATAADGHGNVRVLDAGAPLAPLLAAARAVVTINSTVALDAAVLGIPALVLGLPNNLSPFVDAGVMAGASSPGGIGPALERILYDEKFRLQIDRDRRGFLARFAIGADGRAAQRSADAVMELMGRGSGS